MNPKDLSEVLRVFTLPEEVFVQLDKYYILHWEVSHCLKKCVGSNWIINHQDCDYIVLFEPGDTFHNIFSPKQNPKQQVKLSFRKPFQSSCHGYVMIKRV